GPSPRSRVSWESGISPSPRERSMLTRRRHGRIWGTAESGRASRPTRPRPTTKRSSPRSARSLLGDLHDAHHAPFGVRHPVVDHRIVPRLDEVELHEPALSGEEI